MKIITAPVGEKAQITLPKPIRELLNIKNSGELVGFIVEGKTVKLTKAIVIPEIQELTDEEAKKLVNMGYNFNLPAMSGIGYREIGMFLRGEITLPTATQQIKFETHRFARHQYAWFKLKDDRIHWFDIQTQVDPEITALVNKFVGVIIKD